MIVALPSGLKYCPADAGSAGLGPQRQGVNLVEKQRATIPIGSVLYVAVAHRVMRRAMAEHLVGGFEQVFRHCSTIDWNKRLDAAGPLVVPRARAINSLRAGLAPHQNVGVADTMAGRSRVATRSALLSPTTPRRAQDWVGALSDPSRRCRTPPRRVDRFRECLRAAPATRARRAPSQGGGHANAIARNYNKTSGRVVQRGGVARRDSKGIAR